MKKNDSAATRAGLAAALAGAAALAAAAPALAIEHGVYIAADYASFRFDSPSGAEFDSALDPFMECYVPYVAFGDYYCEQPADVALAAPTGVGRKTKGYDLWVGYQFSHWLAVEGAYLDLGKTHHAFAGTIDLGDVDGDNVPDGPLPLAGRTTFRTRGPAFAAVAALELGEFISVDARAGLFFADNKLGISSTVTIPSGPEELPTYNQSSSKTRLFYGASATFWITPYFGVRGGAAAYNKGSFDSNVKQVFLGIRYSYGF